MHSSSIPEIPIGKFQFRIHLTRKTLKTPLKTALKRSDDISWTSLKLLAENSFPPRKPVIYFFKWSGRELAR